MSTACLEQKSAAVRLVEAINNGEAMTYAEQLGYLGHLEEIRAELRTILQKFTSAVDRVEAATIASEVMTAYDSMLKDQNEALMDLSDE